MKKLHFSGRILLACEFVLPMVDFGPRMFLAKLRLCFSVRNVKRKKNQVQNDRKLDVVTEDGSTTN